MSELVTLTVVGSELEAEQLCGMLREAGVEAMHRGGSLGAGVLGGGGPSEVLVRPEDEERARGLLGGGEPEPA